MTSPRMMTQQDRQHMYDHIFGANEDISPEDIVGRVVHLFMQKSAGYSGDALSFGEYGEVLEISRKFWKLFNYVQHGHGTGSEPPDEVAMDMIGHLLMFIYHYRESKKITVNHGMSTMHHRQRSVSSDPNQPAKVVCEFHPGGCYDQTSDVPMMPHFHSPECTCRGQTDHMIHCPVHQQFAPRSVRALCTCNEGLMAPDNCPVHRG